MKTRWRTVLGIVLAVATLVFLFGAAVKVPFVEPEVPIGKAIASMDWGRLDGDLTRSDLGLSFLVSCAMILATIGSGHRWLRMGMLGLGFAAPLWIMEPVFAFVPFVSPLIIGSMVLGSPDGEFYGEDSPQAAAVGLLMLACLACFVREAYLAWKQRPLQEAGSSLRSARVER